MRAVRIVKARRHNGMRAHGRKGLTSPEQDALTAAALWIVFHVQCEEYDVGICTGQRAGDGSGVMPRNATETGIIARHAGQVSMRLVERANRLGLSMAIVQAAEQYVQRMPYGVVERDYPQALLLIGGRYER